MYATTLNLAKRLLKMALQVNMVYACNCTVHSKTIYFLFLSVHKSISSLNLYIEIELNFCQAQSSLRRSKNEMVFSGLLQGLLIF